MWRPGSENNLFTKEQFSFLGKESNFKNYLFKFPNFGLKRPNPYANEFQWFSRNLCRIFLTLIDLPPNFPHTNQSSTSNVTTRHICSKSPKMFYCIRTLKIFHIENRVACCISVGVSSTYSSFMFV